MLFGIVVLGAALAVAVGTTTASAHSYDFSSCAQVTMPSICIPNVQLPGIVSLPFTSDGDTVTADGFTKPDTPAGLFIKNEGPLSGQNGLGIGNQANQEIDALEYVSLDLSKLAAEGITSGTLSIESVQAASTPPPLGTPTELFSVCNSTADNAFCSGSTFNQTFGENGLAGPDSWAGTVDWTAGAPFLEISGVNNTSSPPAIVLSDVLVSTLVTAEVKVPEPGSMALIATGLDGLVFARYRKVF
jgi:hypothetical protein